MRKSRFSKSRAIEILKEGDAEAPVADLLRTDGLDRATCLRRKGKYGSASVCELPRRKELDTENDGGCLPQIGSPQRTSARSRSRTPPASASARTTHVPSSGDARNDEG